MKLYLTRCFLDHGEIEEVEGSLLTGNRSLYQVNGKGTGRSRIYSGAECHETLDSAIQEARRLLVRERSRINAAEIRLALDATHLSRLEENWADAVGGGKESGE